MKGEKIISMLYFYLQKKKKKLNDTLIFPSTIFLEASMFWCNEASPSSVIVFCDRKRHMKYIIILVGKTINSGVNQKNISHSVALSSLTKPKCLKITSIGSPRNYSSKKRQFFLFQSVFKNWQTFSFLETFLTYNCGGSVRKWAGPIKLCGKWFGWLLWEKTDRCKFLNSGPCGRPLFLRPVLARGANIASEPNKLVTILQASILYLFNRTITNFF